MYLLMTIISKCFINESKIYITKFIKIVFRDTYIEQEAKELVNDFNDRCIRKACTWYMNHLPDAKFVFLTDDVNNRNIALEEGITSCSSNTNILPHVNFCIDIYF